MSAIRETIERVLREESAALVSMATSIDPNTIRAVEMMRDCEGRVVTCGVGKSGHIARKVAGTLSSTGTASLFMHAAEAVHGDLGMVTSRDIVLLYTHSGETDEIVRLFPALAAIGAATILITGRPSSSAGRLATIVISTGVENEACAINLAPTTSTTAMLAMSDAIAIAVMVERGFGPDDFAKFHPSGALGKRLLLTVRDVMRAGDDCALVKPELPILDVMQAITQAGTGAAVVIDGTDTMLGFISDGDLRRHFLSASDPRAARARDLMVQTTTTASPDLLAADALEYFQNLPKKIGELPVIEDGRVVGLLVLKDLLRSGIL